MIKSYTLRVLQALGLADMGVCVAEVSDVTIIVVPTSANMRVAIADWCGVLTVEITVMTSRTTAIVGPAVSTAVEAVVVVFIADLVKAVTERIIIADVEVTLVSCRVALVVVRTVAAILQSSTARDALRPVAVVAVVRVGVGVCHVAHPVEHLTLLVVPAAAHVGAAAGGVTAGAVCAVFSEVRTA